MKGGKKGLIYLFWSVPTCFKKSVFTLFYQQRFCHVSPTPFCTFKNVGMGCLTVCASFPPLPARMLLVDTWAEHGWWMHWWLLCLGHLYTFLSPQKCVTLTDKTVLKTGISVVCITSAWRAAPLQLCRYRSKCSQILLVNCLISA